MRFGFLSECETPEGTTYHRRYWEVINEVVLAEEMGFDFFGTSEQHFLCGLCSVSAPESFYPAIAMRTSHIRLRHMVVVLPFNHPVRVAERIATEDILSNGRIELGTGRANTLLQLDGFQCAADKTRELWEEALEVVMKAFLHDPFSHEGKHFTIPPRSLTPKGLQYPHPPVFMATQSAESHKLAADKGIGALSFDLFLGREYLEQMLFIYKSNIKYAKPVGGFVTNSFAATSFNVFCAPSIKEATRDAREPAMRFVRAAVDTHESLAQRSKSYPYAELMERVRLRMNDFEWLCNETSVLVGNPDFFIERIKRYHELGVDEIIMRFDGNHEQIKRSIELVGKYVIPHFKTPGSMVVGPSPFLGPVP